MARQVADQTGYAQGYNDPVRGVNPYSPTQLVNDGGTARVPVVGILALAAVVLIFEHLRQRRGGRK
jgi:hypothetical protein